MRRSCWGDSCRLTEQSCAQGLLDTLQRDEEGIARSIVNEEQLLGQEVEDTKKFLDRIEAQYVEPNAFVRFLRSIGIGKA